MLRYPYSHAFVYSSRKAYKEADTDIMECSQFINAMKMRTTDSISLKGDYFQLCQQTATEKRARQVHCAKSYCVGCGTCVGYCPSGILKLADNRAVFVDQKCVGCVACFQMCPLTVHVVDQKMKLKNDSLLRSWL
ncbi:phosphoadenosine_phosphosulfate reductase [Hexamita inflata]|uniref:Phosphoadenosine phosphosulfate reductase n=1 Tax=Hexamita inflata TaxID=28002 RepID=A0AA86PM84_9EUKA|nr:phosphoadenosine phosphosulfate reductase [Hexamita inflata]CAI9940822.1 phosphoadenosine phosphosulfate reductase [Hexamita inflata]